MSEMDVIPDAEERGRTGLWPFWRRAYAAGDPLPAFPAPATREYRFDEGDPLPDEYKHLLLRMLRHEGERAGNKSFLGLMATCLDLAESLFPTREAKVLKAEYLAEELKHAIMFHRLAVGLDHEFALLDVPYAHYSFHLPRESWADESLAEQTRLNGRQGVRYALQEGMTVMDPQTMRELPADGRTMGEIMFRGNIVMKGYLKNPSATEGAFAGGWFHTGDRAVLEPDRYVKIKDRSKDVIISGGENISSIEVEDALYQHPAVMACAVVAMPHPRWGETPLAYVELKPGATATAEELIAHCRGLLAGYKVPNEAHFEEIPKTSTGKIQKFQLRERVKSASAIE